MISISTAEQNAFQGSSPKNLILNFPIGRTLTNEDILMESLVLEQSICEESNLTFGAVYSSCFTVKIFDDGLSYDGLSILPQISVTVGEDTYTRDLGHFTVKSDKLTSDKIYRELKCYDALVDVLPFDYADWHNQRNNTFTLKQYRDAFFTYIGVTQTDVSLPNDNVTLKKFTVDKISGAQIISAILQLTGTFGYIGYDGEFKYVTPKTTPDYTIEDYSFIQGSLNYEDEPMKKISGVRLKGYSDDYGSNSRTVADIFLGNSTYSVLTIEDNHLFHACPNATRLTLCSYIYSSLVDFTYYPSQVQFPAYVGLELGDVFSIVTTRKTIYFPVLKRTLNGISALRDAFEAKGESEITSNANSVSSGYDSAQVAINQMRLSVAELLADKATITSLNAAVGRIVDLETNYVTVNNTLTVHTANIANLNANKANVSDLNASNARIVVLEGGYANIATLEAGLANVKSILAGNAGVGDLQTIHLTASNAVVDAQVIRSLMAQYVTVDHLMAGDISTDKFNIVSDDGAIKIDGSTQTFKDANGNVRIQIGLDAQNNFTFVLYDATGQGVLIDSTGIKDSAISDGLIVNRHVANNAAIAGSKLDIASVFTAMNSSNNTVLNSSHIWMDEENQSLNAVYSQMYTDFTDLSDDVSDALDAVSEVSDLAQAANANAEEAMRAIAGISSLDNLTAILTNDSHTIHTNYDGTGGTYYGASTTVNVYKGDTDVSAHSQIDVVAESNVTGTWNSATRTYTVSNLSATDGYVDFTAAYGVTTGYFYMPDGKRLVMPDNKVFKMFSETATVRKRFSLSKAPDGRAGVSWNLMVSAAVVTKKANSTFEPASVVFSAQYNDGMVTTAYSGRFKVEESTNGSTYTEKYVSTNTESSHTYVPSNTAKFIKCSLYDTSGTLLDTQSVIVISDTDEIKNKMDDVYPAVIGEHSRLAVAEDSIEGFSRQFTEVDNQIYGLSNGSILFQTPCTINGDIATFDAVVYKPDGNYDPETDANPKMIESHTDYPSCWFTWYRKTENGTDFLGSGYRMQVDRKTVGYGGSIVGVFDLWDEGNLKMPDGKILIMPDNKYLLIYYDEGGVS